MPLNNRLIKVSALLLSVLFAVVAVMLLTAPHAARALPTSGANFHVNSSADTDFQDSVLTLREAIRVANGTLTSFFNDAEKAQMPDCIFSGSTNNWTITGGCGASLPDWIYFDSNYTITLTSALDILSDTGTLISANPGQVVKINANNGSYNVFEITGNDVQIDGVRVYGAGSGRSNIYITGAAKRVKISNNTIGIDDLGTGTYGLSPNSYGGIYIDSTGAIGGGDARVWIYGNGLCCHSKAGSEGVTLYGTDNVVIGADALGNAGSNEHNIINNNLGNGLVITSGAHHNYIRNSDFGSNGNLGVLITGAGSDYNVVKESLISSNGNTGIQIDGGAQSNRIGSQAGGPITTANTIGGNTGNGIYVSGSTTAYNLIYGNKIGTDSTGTVANANGGNGVVLDNGTHDNWIGNTPTERNIIGGNGIDGIEIVNGSHDNRIQANGIGVNAGASATIPNAYDGIYIASGAYSNTIGDGSGNNQNFIGGNAHYGIEIDGSSTMSNSLLANLIGGGQSTVARPNGWDGLALLNGTHGNIIGGLNQGNWLDSNSGSGIYLAGGAHNNSFTNNIIRYNNLFGIILDGAGTQLNLIQYGYIYNNGYDGLGERNSAGFNIWTQNDIYDNNGLGIDKLIPNSPGAGDTGNLVNAPTAVITSVIGASGIYTVGGTGLVGTAVELYRASPDASGFGEGKRYVGQATVVGSKWQVVDSAGFNPSGCYTVIERTLFSSSEFSANTCRVFLPLVLKNY